MYLRQQVFFSGFVLAMLAFRMCGFAVAHLGRVAVAWQLGKMDVSAGDAR